MADIRDDRFNTRKLTASFRTGVRDAKLLWVEGWAWDQLESLGTGKEIHLDTWANMPREQSTEATHLGPQLRGPNYVTEQYLSVRQATMRGL